MIRPAELAAGAQSYARFMLQKRVDEGKFSRNTYSSNFPPALVLPGEEKLNLLVGFHEDQRFGVIRRAIQEFGVDMFCLVYDGRISRMGDGECEYCGGEGEGCDECLGSGRYRRGDKQDAIITVEMKRGEEPRVTYTAYAMLGGKVIFEKPVTLAEEEPGAKGKHGYNVVWEGAEQR